MKKKSLAPLPTPIEYLDSLNGNEIYIKRDDLIQFALGGNKVRKIEYFIEDAISKKSKSIVTYGSNNSNHCRVVAATAAKLGIRCFLVLSESEEQNANGNSLLFSLYNANIVTVENNDVSGTIEKLLNELTTNGYSPYFIEGGGHGDLGTEAYKAGFDEIKLQMNNIDYIFLASGTGTTQAGLVAGKLLSSSETKVVGISIARKNPRCKEVIIDSLKSYLSTSEHSEKIIESVVVDDSYIGKGYGDFYPEVFAAIKDVACKSDIVLDPVYTGKAFYGMMNYIKKNNIENKKIVFLHTGGLPNVFKYSENILRSIQNEYTNNKCR